MTAARTNLCRITVFGPAGKADLAVPVGSTVACLLPILVHHTAMSAPHEQVVPGMDEQEPEAVSEHGSWVLQRLGEAPLDPDGTPETLDWLEGERLYLRPAENPLPELDFDDIADGMATAVDRQANRWQPEHAKPLFLSLGAVVVATVFVVLSRGSSGVAATIMAAVLALLFAIAATALGRWTTDRALAALPGIAACGFAAVAGLIGVVGPEHVLDPSAASLVIGALCSTGASAALLGAKYSVAPGLPIVPFGVTALTGTTVMIGVWSHVHGGFTLSETAAVLCAAYFVAMIYAPKIVIRLARLRGPQLPRNAEELQTDLEPESASVVLARTGLADRYLVVVTVSGALVYVVSFPLLLGLSGWLRLVLPAVFTVALLLRARHFAGVAQRLAVVVAGASGVVCLVLDQVDGAGIAFQCGTVVLLLIALVPLTLAAKRAPTRRLLPIWAHVGNIVETGTALALIPLMLQVLGVYAWARGLAG